LSDSNMTFAEAQVRFGFILVPRAPKHLTGTKKTP
jgi:hypothetical protein